MNRELKKSLKDLAVKYEGTRVGLFLKDMTRSEAYDGDVWNIDYLVEKIKEVMKDIEPGTPDETRLIDLIIELEEKDI
jgi:hypothetical protein